MAKKETYYLNYRDEFYSEVEANSPEQAMEKALSGKKVAWYPFYRDILWKELLEIKTEKEL